MSKTLHYRACHLCEAICGLAIETESDEGGVPRIRSIKGDPQDSFSRGHVCPKAVALQDIQDDPDRLRQPLRRVGSEWQPIGWDEAFERSLIAAELERPHNSLRSVAEALGIPRKTLHDKLRKHGLPFNTPGENPPDDGE